jgi:hypothetical protein
MFLVFFGFVLCASDFVLEARIASLGVKACRCVILSTELHFVSVAFILSWMELGKAWMVLSLVSAV